MSPYWIALLGALMTLPGEAVEDHRRAVLGIKCQDVGASLARHLGVDGGVLVVEVFPDSAAARAGLELHDVIIAVGDRRVKGALDLVRALGGHDVGGRVHLSIRRAGKQSVVEVTLAAAGDEPEASPEEPAKRPGFLGVGYAPVPELLVVHLRLEAGRGVVVTEVLPESAAAKAGLAQYDVLLDVNGYEILGVDDFVRLISESFAGDKLHVERIHAGERGAVEVTLEPRPERPAFFQPGLDPLHDPLGARSRLRGKFKFSGPDGDILEFEVPEAFLDVEQLQRELERHLKRFESDFPMDDLKKQVRGLLDDFDAKRPLDLDGILGLDLETDWDPLDFWHSEKAHERILLKQRDGDVEITVERRDGKTSVTVQDGDRRVEGVAPDALEQFSPEVRERIEVLLKELPPERAPASGADDSEPALPRLPPAVGEGKSLEL